MLALAIDQEVDDANRRTQQNFFRPLARALFFQRAQNLQAKAVVRTDQAGAMAMRTRLRGAFQHARTQTLARHLHQTKAGNPANLNARAVGFQLVFQALLDGGVVATLFHVDKVDHDQTGQIAQTQLTRHLFGGLEVGLQRGVFDRAFFGGTARVHVDGHQGFGDADHDIAARFQLHGRVEHPAQIAFDLIAREQRRRLVIALHDFRVAWHDHPHEVFGGAIACLALDQNFVDFRRMQIADRAFDQIAFLVDRSRSNRLERQLADLFPKPHQIFVITANFGLGALGACGANDQTCAFWHFDLLRDFFQFLAVSGLGDLAADAAAARGVGHQHAVAAGQRQIGRQRSPLVAALFFDHLHQHDLAGLDDLLDLIAAYARFARRADFFRDIFLGNRFNLVIGVRGVINRTIRRIALFARAVGVIMVMGVIVVVIMRFGFNRGFDGGCNDGFGLAGLDQGAVVAVFVQIDDIHAVDFAAMQRWCGFCRLGTRALIALWAGFRATVVFLVLGAVQRAFFFQQGLTIRCRDLVVIRMDFGKGQKSVPVAAVIDKGRLKRRLHPGDFGKIDVSGKLAFVQGFKIELFDLVSIHHDDPSFLGMCGVDKHFLRHIDPLRPAGNLRLGGPKRGENMSGRLVRAAARNARRKAAPCGRPSSVIANVAHIIAVHV